MKVIVTLVSALALAASAGGIALAQQSTPKSKAAAAKAGPKAGKGEKVCRYTFPGGQKRSWVCKKEEPCCAWDAFTYVKCGSTITGCL